MSGKQIRYLRSVAGRVWPDSSLWPKTLGLTKEGPDDTPAAAVYHSAEPDPAKAPDQAWVFFRSASTNALQYRIIAKDALIPATGAAEIAGSSADIGPAAVAHEGAIYLIYRRGDTLYYRRVRPELADPVGAEMEFDYLYPGNYHISGQPEAVSHSGRVFVFFRGASSAVCYHSKIGPQGPADKKRDFLPGASHAAAKVSACAYRGELALAQWSEGDHHATLMWYNNNPDDSWAKQWSPPEFSMDPVDHLSVWKSWGARVEKRISWAPEITEYRGLLHFFYPNDLGFIRYRTYDGHVFSPERPISYSQDLATSLDALRTRRVEAFVADEEICLCYQS